MPGDRPRRCRGRWFGRRADCPCVCSGGGTYAQQPGGAGQACARRAADEPGAGLPGDGGGATRRPGAGRADQCVPFNGPLGVAGEDGISGARLCAAFEGPAPGARTGDDAVHLLLHLFGRPLRFSLADLAVQRLGQAPSGRRCGRGRGERATRQSTVHLRGQGRGGAAGDRAPSPRHARGRIVATEAQCGCAMGSGQCREGYGPGPRPDRRGSFGHKRDIRDSRT